jgi:hypothetical protein
MRFRQVTRSPSHPVEGYGVIPAVDGEGAQLVFRLADGATQFRQKPFSIHTLLQRVRAVLAAEPPVPPE